MSEVVNLTKELVLRHSVTPDDAGCQALIAERLQRAGFECESLRFGAVDNLWARHGSGAPVLVLLGHTDVVPPGPRDAWTSDPFEPEVQHLLDRPQIGPASEEVACKSVPQHMGRDALRLKPRFGRQRFELEGEMLAGQMSLPAMRWEKPRAVIAVVLLQRRQIGRGSGACLARHRHQPFAAALAKACFLKATSSDTLRPLA